MKPLEPLNAKGLNRRMKQHLHAKRHCFFAICTPGFEDILLKEVQSIETVCDCVVTQGGIEFWADFASIPRLNLLLRVATRILLRIDAFTCRSYPELFNKCQRIPWERYLGFSPQVNIEVSARQSRLHHTDNIQKTVCDAVVQYVHAYGSEIQLQDSAALRIYVRFIDDFCTLSMDTTGEPLHKRNQNYVTGEAPLRRTMASALLQKALFHTFSCIADPFCGSGSILIEAASMFTGRYAGANRDFGFQSWPSFQQKPIERLVNQMNKQGHASFLSVKLYGSDIDENSIHGALTNALNADVNNFIQFEKADCMDFNRDRHLASTGLLISNLPYGKRISADISIVRLYQEFGQHLRKWCRSWKFGFLVMNTDTYKSLGLVIDSKEKFMHGGLEVLFIQGTIQ